MAELPGILNWAIRGAVEWHKTGLRPPASVMLATLNYRNASDQLAEFKTECCICSSGASATPASLYARYKGWAEHEGMTEKERIGRNSFLKLLEEQGFKRTRTEQERLILGIRIKESWEAQQIPESEKVSAGDDGLNSDDGSECHNDTFESDPVSLENPLAVSSREPKTASKVSFRQKVSGCDCESRHPAKEDCRDETWWEDDDENWHCGVHHAMPTDISGGDI